MSKKSYYSKADLISFARFIVSDERRLQKQKETRDALAAGTINPKPWTVTERIVTEDDFKDWKQKHESK